MTKKTVKDLCAEFSLMKEEHNNLKTKYDALAAKYEILDKKYEECCNKKIRAFKCNQCDEKCETLSVLNKHKKKHQTPRYEKFECDECKKCFGEEWKLSAHLKSHKMYLCNKCDKSFKWQVVMEKHVRISHENVKLFCHYFNNGLECPYNDECIFIHEDSEVCKYGAMCERNNCMYKHKEENDDVENEEIDITEENEVDESDEGNKTFVNPFLSNSKEFLVEEQEEDAEENCEIKGLDKEKNVEESFECDFCDFETTDSRRFKRHQDYHFYNKKSKSKS